MLLLRILFSLVFLFYILTANSALRLELTQGTRGTIPIAVVPFSGQSDISTIISQDLTNSGRFQLTDSSQFPAQPTDASQVNFSDWQKLKTNYLVLGQVHQEGSRLRVSFQLLNVYYQAKQSANNAAPAWQSAILASKSFYTTPENSRAVAHLISDQIYQALTGNRGIFSTRLAYVLVNGPLNNRSYTLEVSDYDGFNPRVLLRSSQPVMSPSWSPNGRELAYVSFEGNKPSIYVQNVATGGRRVISNYPGINGAPAFSPDGRQVALVLTQTGYPKIYLMNLASGSLKQVTDGNSIDTEPSFSPNGNTLLFTSNRGGGPQIYQLDLSSQQVQRVTFSGNYNTTASYLPNGQGFVVLHGDSGNFAIAYQDNSGRLKMLTSPDNLQSPSISPNSEMVVYTIQNGAQSMLAITGIDTSVKLILPSQNGSVREPAWSPFI